MNFDFARKERNFLLERVGCIEQLAHIRQSVLDDGRGRGTRIAEFVNGSGLNFTVNIDRGMDIADATFKGIPLDWKSSNRYVAPSFYEPEGLSWLRTWGGGLLTGCGLRNVGGPDSAGGETHGLHGRISHIPAEDVTVEKQWIDGKYVQSISGWVKQTAVFFENLHLRRKISSVMGENSITIEDTIENHGFAVSPLMLLYHMNLGFPLLNENAYIEADNHNVVPRDGKAALGIKEWHTMTPPQPGYSEQVFYHEIPPGKDGFACVTLKNPDLKLAFKLEYRTAELPYFVQWKQMGQGEYVVGFEPANCHPEGQTAESKRGTLREIGPGERISTCLKITIQEQ